MKTPLLQCRMLVLIIDQQLSELMGNVPYCHGFIAYLSTSVLVPAEMARYFRKPGVLGFSYSSRCTKSGWKACTFKFYNHTDLATSG